MQRGKANVGACPGHPNRKNPAGGGAGPRGNHRRADPFKLAGEHLRHDWGRRVSTRGLEDTAALLDEKRSNQVNERGGSSEKTAAAKLDYRLGQGVAAEELKEAVSGACSVPSGSQAGCLPPAHRSPLRQACGTAQVGCTVV